MDRAVRAQFREWLRLPKDFPLGAFHARVASGGLGIPCFSSWIPLLRRSRLARLQDSTSAFFKRIAAFVADSPAHAITFRPVLVGDRPVEDKGSAGREWTSSL